MKILQISSAVNFGSGEKNFVDLCRGLSEKGSDVFAAVRPNAEWIERLSFLPPENILELPLRNHLDISAARRLARIIREKNVEILHAHLGRDYLPASLAARMSPQAKFVLSRHVLSPMKLFHKFVLKNVARAIAVSTPVEANLEKIFPKEKIALIPYGIEIEHWSENNRERLRREFRFEHNISFEAILIGTIGKLKILKGQRDFVLAAQILAEKFPDAYFLISGRDNSVKQKFRRELKRLVKVFNLENRFLFLDWVEDSAPLLAALDVFVSASHAEGFGLAILEATASGTAVVAAETVDAKQLIEDGITGKLVPIKEPLQLAAAIGELLQDETLRRTLGKNAQKIAKENFGLERVIDETEALYFQIIENSPRKF